MHVDLSTARVIVTGGGSGLGRAYCLDLARSGVGGLLINDADRESALKVASEVRALLPRRGPEAAAARPRKTVVGTNAARVGADETEMESIVADCIRQLGGPPTGVVNNAGVLRDVAFRNQSKAQWQQVYEVHLLGVRELCRRCWPHFLQQGYGKIVNVSSMNGVCGAHGQTNYASTVLRM
eukprot:g3962.t1